MNETNRMKTIVLVFLSIVVLLLGWQLSRNLINQKQPEPPEQHLYPKTAMVIEVDHTKGTVTCEDYNGFRWVFYGAEDWMVRDCVSLLMNDNGTPGILDDSIVKTHYSAWEIKTEEATQ